MVRSSQVEDFVFAICKDGFFASSRRKRNIHMIHVDSNNTLEIPFLLCLFFFSVKLERGPHELKMKKK